MAIPLMAAAAMGAAAGGGAGWLLGQKGERNPYGTLNPEQISMLKSLGPRLETLSGAPEYYSGDMTSPMTSAETSNINRFNALSKQGYGTFESMMDYNDPAFESQFREEMIDPAFQNFREYTQPILEEAVPHSGSARASLVGSSLRDLQSDLMTKRFDAREAAKNRALNAASGLPSYGESTTNVLSVPRQVAQAGLDRDYMEYVRGNEQNRADINAALAFLGISTVTEKQDTRGQMALSGALGGANMGLNAAGAYNSNAQMKKLIEALNK